MVERGAATGAPQRKADFGRKVVIQERQFSVQGADTSVLWERHQSFGNIRESDQELHFVLKVARANPLMFVMVYKSFPFVAERHGV